VPTGIYFNDIKKRLIAVRPTTALKIIRPLLLPKKEILLKAIKILAKNKEPIDLKNTISKVGNLDKYFTNAFIRVNENVLIIM